MSADHPLVVIVAAAVGGVGLGFGLVVGAFVVRSLRRYIDNGDDCP